LGLAGSRVFLNRVTSGSLPRVLGLRVHRNRHWNRRNRASGDPWRIGSSRVHEPLGFSLSRVWRLRVTGLPENRSWRVGHRSFTRGSFNGRISSGSPSLFRLCQTHRKSGSNPIGVDPPENRATWVDGSPVLSSPVDLSLSPDLLLPLSRHLSPCFTLSLSLESLSLSASLSLSPSVSRSLSVSPYTRVRRKKEEELKEAGRR
jgi:hypothetical protein